MNVSKRRTPIAREEISVVFSDEEVEKIAKRVRLPIGVDFKVLAQGVHEAAGIYVGAAREPTGNEQHREILKLQQTASRALSAVGTPRWEAAREAADLVLRNLSEYSRSKLNARGSRQSIDKILPETIRTAEDCETVRQICTVGGRWVTGRMRSTGRRSQSWQASIHAPLLVRHFPKRDVELDFVMWLRIAWCEATGTCPPLTAHHERPGPFAKFTQECLRKVGAPHVDAVGLINQLQRLRLDRRHLSRSKT